MATENPESVEDRSVTLQAGLRTLHEKGPELKRAISGQLDEMLEQVSANDSDYGLTMGSQIQNLLFFEGG